ncbi:hypothetical protein [Actinomadura rudentiformis]|uniref:Helix-turn-helix domain-containing protein n=1 Tax=Actinomadura rudentiformis TaxID=359158 RepID=A0A6H9YSL8_9ACTN|nr:hypothetical protein [Actinomadura rudentiformis]KAB2348453.1 hypothetical protein F8566_16855 [Actinomadura rudentiformis]
MGDRLTRPTGRPASGERARRIPGLIEAAKGVLAHERGAAMAEATEDGRLTPAELARQLGISRTKAYEAIDTVRRCHGDLVNARLDKLAALAHAALTEQHREPGDIVVITWNLPYDQPRDMSASAPGPSSPDPREAGWPRT